MTTASSLTVAALNIDCVDAAALADFWGKALGRPVSPGAVPGDTTFADPEGNGFDLVTWQPK
jgi:hypothetical protein